MLLPLLLEVREGLGVRKQGGRTPGASRVADLRLGAGRLASATSSFESSRPPAVVPEGAVRTVGARAFAARPLVSGLVAGPHLVRSTRWDFWHCRTCPFSFILDSGRKNTRRKETVMQVRRKTFDLVLTFTGIALTVVLAAAGALLMWGYSFANSNVHNQLARQEIYFPTKAQFANAKPGTEITPSMRPYLEQYAGQQVLTGQQAEAYADHFISVHLSEMPFGGVYSKVSTAARQATPGTPEAAKLNALESTVFQGTTLRGLLLTAYAFGTFAQIALVSAIVAFSLGALTLILSLLGLIHWRRVPETVMFPRAYHGGDEATATAA